MKILIIGSQGFIGASAYKYFVGKSHHVLGVDVVDDTNNQRYYNLSRHKFDFEQIFKKEQFDVCINASGNGSVPISINRPLFDFELNTYNVVKLLDAIRLHNSTCKFINLSSAAVYGNPSSLPIKEQDMLKPLSPYGWHKVYSEQICREYYYLYNIQTINLRLFSVYGEGLRKQLFWDIYQKCLRSKTIELFGSGEETRDFIYINDLIYALDVVMHKGLFNGEAVNIASGIETTIKEAAGILCKNINESIKIGFNDIVKPGDPLNWRADVTILKSFGFKGTASISEGLKNTAKWLKESK